MREYPIYVVVGTVYVDNDGTEVVHQEFIECETYNQAVEQSIAFEKQLNIFYPDKRVSTWINQF